MFDESTGNEPKILTASFADPYLVLIRDDLSICLIQCDGDGDLEEVELGESMRACQWMSGCLYRDGHRRFGGIQKGNGAASTSTDIRLFMLSAEGALHVSLTIKREWFVPDAHI